MLDFESQNVEHPDFDTAKMFRWITAVASDHSRRIGSVSYRFCNDEDILDANRKFLGHDYYTDIITFDYSRGDRIGGDILISLDTVASNAAEIGVPFDEELRRVIIHGILHLCGIDDKGPGEREIMEAEENKALAMWDTI